MAITKITNNSLSSSAAIARDKLADTLTVSSYSNVANGGFANNTWEAIEFSNEVIDTNNAFAIQEATDNNNGGVFTAPTAGKYLILVNMIAKCTVANRLTQGSIRLVLNTNGNAATGGTEINGTQSRTTVPDDASNGSATDIAMSTSCVQSCSAGDKIWSQFRGNCGDGAVNAEHGNFTVIQID